MFKRVIPLVAGCVIAVPALAQSASRPCITPGEAEALLVYSLPTAVETAQTQCRERVDAKAAIMQRNSEQMKSYRTESKAAWPQARKAIGKLTGSDRVMQFFDASTMQSLADGLVAGLLADQIKPGNCQSVAFIYEELAPLPPRNLARIAVHLVQQDKERASKLKFRICPTRT